MVANPGPLFEGLAPDAVQAICAEASVRELVRGGELFRQGDPPAYLYLLTGGRIKMSRVTEAGAPLTVGLLGPGELVGCVAVFRQVPYPATASALDDSIVLAWPAARMREFTQAYPRLAMNALEIVGERAASMLNRLQEVSTAPVEQRLAKTLLRVMKGTEDPPVIRLSRQELAELTATTLYTVSRIVSRWCKQGIVAAGKGRVTLLDPVRLRQIAESDPGRNLL